ncbi:MAG: PIN domain-containing protein [Nitrospirota bacterium]
MIIFVDTSAFYALLDRDDISHRKAKRIWNDLITPETTLITNNYVLLESFAVIQNRLGMESVRVFQEDIQPIVEIKWIDESIHRLGVSALLTAAKREISLVDCVSFETMRTLGIKTVFAFDPHFKEQGFNCIP